MFLKRISTQFLQIKVCLTFVYRYILECCFEKEIDTPFLFHYLQEFFKRLRKRLILPKSRHGAFDVSDVELTPDTEVDEDDDLTRDEFNLHKMIVVMTRPGKVPSCQL